MNNVTKVALTPLKSPLVQLIMSHIFFAGHRGVSGFFPERLLSPPTPLPLSPVLGARFTESKDLEAGERE